MVQRRVEAEVHSRTVGDGEENMSPVGCCMYTDAKGGFPLKRRNEI